MLVLLVTVTATAAAVWRATTTEQARGRERVADQQVDGAAADAIYALADLRATLHAYVAPGQGLAFWAGRFEEQMGRIRTLITAIEPAASAARHPMAEALDALDKVATAETRARRHATDGQMLVAGDIIFQESGGLIDQVAAEISGARQALARAVSAREAGTTNAMSLLAGGVLAIWIVSLLLLVPLPGPEKAPSTAASVSGLSLRDTPLSGPSTAPAGPTSLGSDEPASGRAPAAATPSAPVPVSESVTDLDALATVCRDLSLVSDARELNPLLARAAAVLGARGLMIWLVDPSGASLIPTAAHGYEPSVLSRLGPTSRDADNLMASAFRARQPAMSIGTARHSSAVAVPLTTPDGPSGVLAVELPEGVNHDLKRTGALAGVFAAQLSGLFPVPAPPSSAADSATAQA